MKQRVTYILPPGSVLKPSDIELDHNASSLTFAKAALAVEEWKFTLGMDELPEELSSFLLEKTHELHIRWTSERNARFLPPLVSRLPAGMHVSYTPGGSMSDAAICPLLDRLLQPETTAKCVSISQSFTHPELRSGRFAHMATWQWYQLAPLHDGIGRWILSKVCPEGDSEEAQRCRGRLDGVSSASYVDLDFDAISHALTLTAAWSPYGAGVNASSIGPDGEARMVRKVKQNDRVEVGTLQVEQGDEPEESSLGGFLTVIGEDDKPNPTMFSFPSRHHPLPTDSRSSYRASFQHPPGLHPKLDVTLRRENLKPPKDSCALHAYWTLPSFLFVDRYQLSDPLFLAAHNLVSLRSLSGEEDLEAPDWIINRWGSAALVELAMPLAATADDTDLTITFPTHLRYLAADLNSTNDQHGYRIVDVPWPSVFWACDAEEGLKMGNNPFDRTNLGFDGLFGPKTMFYHIPPVSDVHTTVSVIRVPVLDPEAAAYVRLGTAPSVLAGFGWVCWRLFKGMGTGLQTSRKGGKKTQ